MFGAAASPGDWNWNLVSRDEDVLVATVGLPVGLDDTDLSGGPIGVARGVLAGRSVLDGVVPPFAVLATDGTRFAAQQDWFGMASMYIYRSHGVVAFSNRPILLPYVFGDAIHPDVSSIWIAYAPEKDGGCLISVDHMTEFADRTQPLLNRHGVNHLAEVRLAELRQLNINGDDFQWYNEDALRDINEIDLLLVDGPPSSLGEMARYPALHALESQLASNAVVILDDADRPDEQGIVRRWITEVAGLREEREIFSRVAVLTYCRP